MSDIIIIEAGGSERHYWRDLWRYRGYSVCSLGAICWSAISRRLWACCGRSFDSFSPCWIYPRLKPGSVLLLTVPGISRIGDIADEQFAKTWYWTLTASSTSRLLGRVIQVRESEVEMYGNVFAAVPVFRGSLLKNLIVSILT